MKKIKYKIIVKLIVCFESIPFYFLKTISNDLTSYMWVVYFYQVFWFFLYSDLFNPNIIPFLSKTLEHAVLTYLYIFH